MGNQGKKKPMAMVSRLRRPPKLYERLLCLSADRRWRGRGERIESVCVTAGAQGYSVEVGPTVKKGFRFSRPHPGCH